MQTTGRVLRACASSAPRILARPFTATARVSNAAKSKGEVGAPPQLPSASKPEKAELDFTTAGRPQGGKLAKIIRDSIKITGPIPISRYMQFCLSHPTEGYYSQGDVFGRKGDFVTSPEISQVFGETLKTFPACYKALTSVHLIDNSLKMQALQSDKLTPRIAGSAIKLEWYDRLEDVPVTEEFTMLVAHEFFDAMPINLFEKTAEGFREVFVGLDAASGLHLTLSKTPTTLSSLLPDSSPRFTSLPVASRVEISQDSYKIARQAGSLLSSSPAGGAGLIIDYGADHVHGSSFRAFKSHEIIDIFEEPGTADLTANVDFAYLKEAIGGLARTHGPISQKVFLEALGLQPRLMALLAGANVEERRKMLESGAKRLVDESGMGAQYQVMAITSMAHGEGEGEQVYPFPVKKVQEKTQVVEEVGAELADVAAVAGRSSSSGNKE